MLAASVEEAKVAPPATKDATSEKPAPLDLVAQGPFVNVRQEHILDTLEALRATKLDTISTQYQTNPKLFLATLKESSINNKAGVVDGTGNSITSASFNPVMRKLVAPASQKEVDTLEQELQLSIRKDTNDILLTNITSNLKLRVKEFNATASNIKKQEKLLGEEEKRNVRIEEKTVKVNELTMKVQTNSITDHYFLDPKLFMTNLKSNRTGKTMLMTDLTTYLKENIPQIKKEENEQFKMDLLEADKKLNVQDQYLHISFAAVEKLLKQRLSTKTKLLKEIEKEKKLLQKDIDKASTVTDAGGGGCCGGGGGNVHDPNATPQDLPSDAKNKTATKGNTKDSGSGSSSNSSKDDTKIKDKTAEPKSEVSSSSGGGRGRSSSDAHDRGYASSSDGENEDLPRYDPNSVTNDSSNKNIRILQTADTLTYSDNGDDKSEDSGMMFDRRGDEKPMDRGRQVHMRRGGHGSSRGDSSRGFGKPRDVVERTLSDVDASDDDSLIFGSMKKK